MNRRRSESEPCPRFLPNLCHSPILWGEGSYLTTRSKCLLMLACWRNCISWYKCPPGHSYLFVHPRLLIRPSVWMQRHLLIQLSMWIQPYTLLQLPCRALSHRRRKEPWDVEYNFHKHSFEECGPGREEVLCTVICRRLNKSQNAFPALALCRVLLDARRCHLVFCKKLHLPRNVVLYCYQ